MDKLIKQLAQIQKTLNAPKSRHNNFGNYDYRNCEDILDAVKPLLGDLVITLEDEVILIGERYYIKATASLTDGINHVKASAFARESLDKKGMDDSQITGAASSYARKYALNGLFAIDDTKDADSDKPKENKKTTIPAQKPKQTTEDLAAFASWSEKIDKAETKEDLVGLEEAIKVAGDIKPAEKFMLRKKIETKAKDFTKVNEPNKELINKEPDIPTDFDNEIKEVNIEDLPF